MARVRLNNPDIILMPLSNREKDNLERQFMGNESIYVLYRLPDSEEIHIGMMAESIRKNSVIKNVKYLNKATTKAYFYDGASILYNKANEITDRPIYQVFPSNKRTVLGYNILNFDVSKNARVKLDDIVNGNTFLDDENFEQHKL